MKESVRDFLAGYEEEILAAPRRRLNSAPDWASDVPLEAGVYVVWDARVPVYVGETSSLKARMSDIGRPVNHTFARKVCKALGISQTSLEDLASAMSARYELAFVTAPLGRVEIEEYLILRWQSTLLNKPGKRLLKSPQYAWVKPV